MVLGVAAAQSGACFHLVLRSTGCVVRSPSPLFLALLVPVTCRQAVKAVSGTYFVSAGIWRKQYRLFYRLRFFCEGGM